MSQRKVSNPLTVIAIFAGLAEVASTAALAAVEPPIQGVFVWFVMLFPTLLVLLFFLTLNFNPHVLYAPSDFKEDQNFLEALRKEKKLDKSFSEVSNKLAASTAELNEQISKLVDIGKGTEAEQLKHLISKKFDEIQQSVYKAQETAESTTTPLLPRSEFQATLVELLYRADQGMTLEELSEAAGRSVAMTKKTLLKLVSRGIVLEEGERYRLNDL